ncbi:phosphoribosyl-ATP pyrophosphatase /phosphoribosyl-AMP cyclohydrolase [Cyclonatronum proteinivorum]|uniref:Histidine biosynthesis bifunctional protein HisIE n=1 Tax=Cyclonatronum proteinivorum TaxID=1457365 RepID=A0A345UKJ4_9BACT|nr:bifunctional phosphoribosyl-AMP cyclohydrolase/phosphoribosyl-ATP diphosphatase HisIE [Cyclonatronum proteinivorum]AXJ00996.1 phosphoribosyl-ATP pyrophosphatase /phosphoribosyl-AMP cyclohydrolase [Cyclonatronum proteinivorum]
MSTSRNFPVDTLKFDEKGLIPAIVQDAESLRVLMLGYMNAASLEKTLESGKVTFFSRSRQQLWIKGESSGNFLHLQSLRYDCDADALLITAHPEGPTCHTGETSCFYRESPAPENELGFLIKLQHLLETRKSTLPEGSYTTSMFKKGLDKIAQKVGEEAVETVIAAKNEDEKEFIYEASDLLFHLMLLLTEKKMHLTDLVKELEKRHS